MKYQPHVDGLRALAVTSVIVFHLRPDLLPGGYLGVDVFFVISGYLITSILREKTRTLERFSLLEFYVRRLRRLFPAMFVTVLASIPPAVFILPQATLIDSAKQIIAAVTNVSNIWYWYQAGYWDDSSDEKLLLHTWSLSVEEQFYILWPLIVRSTSHMSVSQFSCVLVAILLLSLVLNVIWAVVRNEWSLESASTAFFWMPFRIYEFALGGLILPQAVRLMDTSYPDMPTPSVRAMKGKRKLQHYDYEVLTTSSAFLMIFVPMLLPMSTFLPPFVVALLPCIGSCLVIRNGHRGLFSRFLTHKSLLRVGVMSYSLYLVHWPLIVLYKFKILRDLSVLESALMFALTLLLGWLNHEFVEKTFRKTKSSSSGFPFNFAAELQFLKFWVAASLTLLVAGVFLLHYSDLLAPLVRQKTITPVQVYAGKLRRHERIKDACQLKDYYFDEAGLMHAGAECHIERSLQVLVYGNSHEEDGYNSFDYVFGNSEEVNLILFGASNRLVQKNILPFRKQAPEFRRVEVLYSDTFLSKLDVLVISFFGAFNETEYPYTEAEIYESWWPWFVAEHVLERNNNIRIIALGPYIGRLTHDCYVLYAQTGTLNACKAPEFIASSTMSTMKTFQQCDPPASFKNIIQRDNIQYLYIDVLSMLCVKGTLESCLVEIHEEPWAYDRHHKSMAFCEFIGEQMLAKYAKQLHEFGFPNRKKEEFRALNATEIVENEATDKILEVMRARWRKQGLKED